jgi:hypothetical protein
MLHNEHSLQGKAVLHLSACRAELRVHVQYEAESKATRCEHNFVGWYLQKFFAIIQDEANLCECLSDNSRRL